MRSLRELIVASLAIVCLIPVAARAASGEGQNAQKYLASQLAVIEGLEKNLKAINSAAEHSADRLKAGGRLFLAGEKGMIAELAGRAGGLCFAKALPLDKPLPELTANDVVLYSHYGASSTGVADGWAKLRATPAFLVGFGASDNPVLMGKLPTNIRAIRLALPTESRLFRTAENQRVVAAAPAAIAAAQWTYVAELIGACRRRGKQPAIYLSIFLDEGRKRFERTKNLVFDPEVTLQPVATGVYAQQYLAAAKEALTAIQRDELPKLLQAAAWIREARAGGKQIVRSLMGHLPPAEVGLPGDVDLFTQSPRVTGEKGVEWIKQNLKAGDVFVLLGYQQPEDDMAAAAHAVGARTIFLTVKPSSEKTLASPQHLYINPHFPFTDACLELPGYDVKACPLSCVAGLGCLNAICAEAIELASNAPVPLIFDTDMGNDIDDALALATIHALESRGECKLLAVTVTKDNRYAAPYCDLVNTFYGRPQVPVGMVRKGVTPGDSRYLTETCEARDGEKPRYPHRLLDSSQAPDAVELLRKTLAAQADHSVAIAQVGFSTNLARLLDTPGDSYSPLSGKELAAKKVRVLSVMGGAFDPEMRAKKFGEYNIIIDLPSAKKLVAEWPTSIIFSGYEIGAQLKYRATSIESDFRYVAHHPVAEAYGYYLKMPYDRPTWDLTSVLCVVRPYHSYFDLSPPGRATVTDDGQTPWTADAKGLHRYLIVRPEQRQPVIEVLELLSSQPPKGP